jgi:hypothetical protein
LIQSKFNSTQPHLKRSHDMIKTNFMSYMTIINKIIKGKGEWGMGIMRLISTVLIVTGITLSTQGKTCYVRENGSGDGSSWANASADFQGMVDSCTNAGGEVWVAAGAYIPTGWPHGVDNEGNTLVSKEVHFSLRNGVTVLGGFPPDNDAATMKDRDLDNYETIFSGDIGVSGNRSDDSYHVFYHPSAAALDETAMLNGVVVTKGHSGLVVYTAWWHNYGGGMFNVGSSPTIEDCVFRGNYAHYVGGGIFNSGSHPQILNCEFLNNSAGHGGGIYNGNSSPAISNCVFSSNTVKYNGGAVDNHGGSASFDRCVFFNNRVNDDGDARGGTIYNYESRPVFNNTLIVDKPTLGWNDCVENYRAHPSFNSCTFFGMEGNSGTGIRNREYCTVTLTNCIVWGYETSIRDGSLTVSHCLIQGGHSGTGNIDADPKFINPENGIGYDEKWGTFDDGFALNFGSPAIASGNIGSGQPGVDLVGNPRIREGEIEIGAYSFVPDPDNDGMADAWEQQIVAASSGTISNVEGVLAHADFDGDGRDNKNEFVAGTDPLNPSSRFNYSLDIATGEIHYYPCVEGRSYSCAWAIGLQYDSWTEISIPPVSDGSTGEIVSLPDAPPHNSEPRMFYNVLIEM